MTPNFIVIFCGLLMSIAAFSIDIMLPSFPAIAEGLSAPTELVQWTITAFVLAAGFGQLFWGGASDRFGRKAALGGGLAIYLVGCLLAVAASDIGLLLAARAIQGFGAAGAIVSSRAVVRDLFSGEELARGLALATAVFAAGPIIAPLVGGLVAEIAGWRMIFVLLAVFSLLLTVFVIRMPETIPARVPDAMKPSVVTRRIRRMFVHPQSRHFLVLSTIINSSMLLILTTLPVIYDQRFGVAGMAFAVLFALHGIGVIVGQVANRRLIRRLGAVRAMLVACAILILSASLMLAGAATELLSAYSLTALLVLFATSYLIVYSNCAAMVLDPNGDIAGFAASFFGFLSQIGGSLIVSVLVLFIGADAVTFAICLLAICGFVTVGILMWQIAPSRRTAT